MRCQHSRESRRGWAVPSLFEDLQGGESERGTGSVVGRRGQNSEGRGYSREAFGALDVSDVIWLVSLRSQYLLFGEWQQRSQGGRRGRCDDTLAGTQRGMVMACPRVLAVGVVGFWIDFEGRAPKIHSWIRAFPFGLFLRLEIAVECTS